MKYLFLLLFLTACGAEKSVETQSLTLPSVPMPDISASPSASPEPSASANPSATPSPTATPNPNLTCYVNNGVFCTGANLGALVDQLDLVAMFTAGNPNEVIQSVSVQNDLLAKDIVLCSQAGSGCYAHSACVSVVIHIKFTTQSFNAMKCGNSVVSSELDDL